MQAQARPDINPKTAATQIIRRDYTPEEYLALEEKAINKSEYHDGEIIPMSGGTTSHNKIAGNFYKRFPLTINNQEYEIFISDVRLWISQIRHYFYPDIMVIQGEPIYQGSNQTIVTNLFLIIEVLSNSTRDYNRGRKFLYYRSIPEFQEYILIDQYNYHVEQFAKNSRGKWELTEYDTVESILVLESVEFQISLTEIYDRIKFEPEPEEVEELIEEILE